MKLFIICILFYHGIQTRNVTVAGQTTLDLCTRYVKSENGKPEYMSHDKQSTTVFTCVDNHTLRAIQDGLVSVDQHGNIEKREEL